MAEATELDRVFHVLLQNRGLKGPGELGNAKVILVLVRQLLGSYDPVITYTRPHDPHHLPPTHHITPVSIPYQHRSRVVSSSFIDE